MSPWTVSSASALRDFDALGRAGRQSEHRARRPGRRARLLRLPHRGARARPPPSAASSPRCASTATPSIPGRRAAPSTTSRRPSASPGRCACRRIRSTPAASTGRRARRMLYRAARPRERPAPRSQARTHARPLMCAIFGYLVHGKRSAGHHHIDDEAGSAPYPPPPSSSRSSRVESNRWIARASGQLPDACRSRPAQPVRTRRDENGRAASITDDRNSDLA
jgi:hypothetical protein